MIRSTTNGTLAGYRYNLQRSTHTLNKSRETVLTQRKFNSFAEDPASAARSFQLRRSYLRTESQHTAGESVVKKYDVAWSTLDSVLGQINQQVEGSAYTSIVKAGSDTNAAGRNALGQNLSQLADSIVLTMNGRYGDNYVFSGADGLNIPFTWEEKDGQKILCYRGVDVSSADQTDKDLLKYMATEEAKYADLGLGLEKDADGNIINSSAANTALQGINYLDYGVDDEGLPNNLVVIISRMGEILQGCNATDGSFATDAEKDEFYRLAAKFEAAATHLSDKHVELDSQAQFLKSNQTQLENQAYTLNEQIAGIEDVDLAEAITAFSWAQYCYNAALQSGKSVLSQSLMDYLHN